MSRPESVSSSTPSRGCNNAICKISLRFFSPPENPTLTPRRSISCSMPSLPATSRTRLRNSGVEISSSPRFLRCALSAVRRNVMVATPGISNGYWKARKRPRAARSSAGSARMSSPSSSTCPCVTTYSSLPASTCARVDLPEPFGPISACTLPRPTESSSPLSIFLPSTSTCRFRTSKRFILSHAAFQADRDQLLRLDGKFHRQLLQHVLDEAIDHERGRLFLGQSALRAVEQHVFGNLRGGRLVLEHSRGVLGLDIGHGVGAALIADQKRIAIGEIARTGRAAV